MSLDKWLALAFSLMILGQAYLVRRYVGTWLFPACLFGLFWFGFTFFPLAVLFWIPVHPYAIGFIFLCTLAFSLGSVVFDWRSAFERNKEKCDNAGQVYGSSFLKVVFYASTLSSLAFLILNLLLQGFSLTDLFFDLFTSAGAYADLVASENFKANMFDQFSIVFAYLGVILGGFLFPCMPTKMGRRLIVILSFLPPVVITITQTTKGHLFLSIVFFYAGLLLYRVWVGKLDLFGKISIRSLTLCVVLLIAVATIAFASRARYDVDDTGFIIDRLVGSYASYSCGHIYGFSDWFSFVAGGRSELTYPHENATYGFYTFMALFQLLGSHRTVPGGVFDQYYSYGDLVTGNIYTMFRGLVLDFGIIGSVLFLLATGFLLHWAFHSMLRNRSPVFTVAVFVFMLGYFYSSFIVSLLIWSRIYLTFVLLWVVLQVNKWITQRDGRRLKVPRMASEVAAQT